MKFIVVVATLIVGTITGITTHKAPTPAASTPPVQALQEAINAASPTEEPPSKTPTPTPTPEPKPRPQVVMTPVQSLQAAVESTTQAPVVRLVPPTQPKPVVVPKATVAASKQALMAAAGIASRDWSCADAIVSRESGWNHYARNASSGALGLPQALPGHKMASAGEDYATNPVTQLRWMRNYVSSRYGGFCQAWEWWQSRHWY